MTASSSLRGWWLLASIPALVHFALFAWNVISDGYLIFGRLDLFVMALFLVYLFLIPFLIRTRLVAIGWITTLILLIASLSIANTLAGYWIPQPYFANYPWPPMKRVRDVVGNLPGVKGPIEFSINRWGLRGPEFSPDISAQRILCVGGSTTECLYVTDPRSWPWRLETILQQKGIKCPLFVGNAGRSGQIASQHAFLIRNYEASDKFDRIVVMCGINDLGALLHGNRREREASIAQDTLFYKQRPHEAYYRRLTLWRMGETILDVGNPAASGQIIQDPAGRWIDQFRASRREKLAKNGIDHPPTQLAADLKDYRRDLLSVVEAARLRGSELLLVTQPTMWRANLPKELDDLLWEQTDDAAYTTRVLAEMMAKYNDVLIEVAKETNTRYLDLASQLPADTTVFYDDCHFNDSGCDKVAQAVADALRPLTDVDRPRETSSQEK